MISTTFQHRRVVCGDEQQQAAPQAPNQAQQDERLQAMRRRAEAIKVFVLVDDDRVAADAVAEPLMRYSDPVRGLRDGSMWCWRHKGRPVALFKTSMGGGEDIERMWLEGLNSLSQGLIEAQWADGHQFASRKPGLKFSAIPEGPKPADAPRRRLLQMKELARRVEFTIWPSEGNKQQMRLLPRTLCRYSAQDDGLIDGALFGFTANGTCPDALVAIELVRRSETGAAWQFGFAQLTTGGLSARWDDHEVWSATQKSIVPTAYDEWTWFWAPGKAAETK
ncbi:MAG TPA: hypothetical protein VJ783_24795 [Pirellulales bacterium]|nr:hypothetical protein [Pirellulales bacterium]